MPAPCDSEICCSVHLCTSVWCIDVTICHYYLPNPNEQGVAILVCNCIRLFLHLPRSTVKESMARQRRSAEGARPASMRPTTKSNSHPRKANYEPKFDSKFTIFVVFNGFLILSVVLYVYYLHYLESWVVRPVNLPKVVTKAGLDVPERFWGSYRSSLYFGLKTRSAQPLVAGLMWFTQKLKNQNLAIRHWCNQWDGLPKYGWVRHDGVNFGVQRIVDDEYVIETRFLKRPGGHNGGDWTARIAVKARVCGITLVPISNLSVILRHILF